MCGIYGYVGNPRPTQYLVERIQSLEYRGYDSAGIAYVTPNHAFFHHNGTGDIGNVIRTQNLKLNDEQFELGIAHTRWATHGVPSVRNAHPHEFPDFYLVHNGIIENYEDLIDQYAIRNLQSETDSEIIGWVLHTLIQKNPRAPLTDIISKLRQTLTGSYACLVMFKKDPKMIALRHKSPLLIGIEKNSNNVVVCSDQYGFGDFEGQLYQLNDEESLILEKGKAPQLFDVTGFKAPQFKMVSLKAPLEKDKPKCYFLKEIFEQGHNFNEALLNHQLKTIRASIEALPSPTNLHVVACGSAFHAALYGKYLFDQLGNLHSDASTSSEFRYRTIPTQKGSWHLFVSQSGETADTLESARKSQENPNNSLLSMTTHEDNSLSRLTQNNWPMKCGTEVSVAATKTFTAQIKMFSLLHTALSKSSELPNPKAFQSFFDTLPQLQNRMKQKAEKFNGVKTLVYLGRNLLLPIAMEGALKIKEICYVHAEAFPSGELKHGPLALIDDRTLSICCISKDFFPEKEMNVLHEIKSRKGHVLYLTDSEAIYRRYPEETVLIHHDLPYSWCGIPFVIPLQFFAYEMALLKGVNIDRPRNLAKSVTVE
jgi:glutamine---fructose-6-phosphate transaminase (isomerizing)